MSSWSRLESVILSLHLPNFEWFGPKGSNNKGWEFQLLYLALVSCCVKLRGGVFPSHVAHAFLFFIFIPLFLFHKWNYHFVRLSFVSKCLDLTAVTIIWETIFITSNRKIIWKCAFWWDPSSLRSHFWLKGRHWCYSLKWKMACFPLILK